MVKTEFVEKGKHKNPKFVQPPQIKKYTADPIFSKRLEYTRRAFQRAYLSYSPDDYVTRRKDNLERSNVLLQEHYPDLTSFQLVSIKRVLLPRANMFEFEDGELDSKHKVKSALVFVVRVTVADEDSHRAGIKGSVMRIEDTPVGQIDFKLGVYDAPVPRLSFNRNHEIINSEVDHYVHRFYIKDSAAQIQDIVRRFGKPLHSTPSVAIANETGSTYQNERVYSVFNWDEFVHESIEDLIGANKRNLLSETAGGIKAYRKWRDIEGKLIESGEATAGMLGKISKEDIINLIASKQKEEQEQLKKGKQ